MDSVPMQFFPSEKTERSEGMPVARATFPARRVVYLACPYTDKSLAVRNRRFKAATEAAASLIKQGHIVYSPITMTHPIDRVLAKGTTTLGSDYWVAFDEAFMSVSAEIVVLMIDGWDKSRGVRREIDYFQTHGKPVSYVTLEDLKCKGEIADVKRSRPQSHAAGKRTSRPQP